MGGNGRARGKQEIGIFCNNPPKDRGILTVKQFEHSQDTNPSQGGIRVLRQIDLLQNNKKTTCKVLTIPQKNWYASAVKRILFYLVKQWHKQKNAVSPLFFHFVTVPDPLRMNPGRTAHDGIQENHRTNLSGRKGHQNRRQNSCQNLV